MREQFGIIIIMLLKKLPEKIKEEKKADKTILVYVSIFADRRLSILESAVR